MFFNSACCWCFLWLPLRIFCYIILYILHYKRHHYLLKMIKNILLLIISMLLQIRFCMIHIYTLYVPLIPSLSTYTNDAYLFLFPHSFQRNSCNLSISSLEIVSLVSWTVLLLYFPFLIDFETVSEVFLGLLL